MLARAQSIRWCAEPARGRERAPNRLVTIKGRKHDGFNREEMMQSYAAIREFLRKQGLL
ncbi:MAG TPA: hypothetical protein VF088_13250 [Pyrinomonadaceae bacterium]